MARSAAQRVEALNERHAFTTEMDDVARRAMFRAEPATEESIRLTEALPGGTGAMRRCFGKESA